MKTQDGEDIKNGDLICIKSPIWKNGRYFYVQSISDNKPNIFYGLRVNKDFSFNRRDKENGGRAFGICLVNEIKLLNPVPAAFKESLRTLHFLVDEVLEDFGGIRMKRFFVAVLFRAVRFENGSYGIIQNRLYNDMSGIDYSYEVCNLFEDLSYEELCEKWENKKQNQSAEWIKDYSVI